MGPLFLRQRRWHRGHSPVQAVICRLRGFFCPKAAPPWLCRTPGRHARVAVRGGSCLWISMLRSVVLLRWRSVSSGAASRWPGGSPGGGGWRLLLLRLEATAAIRLARRSLPCLGASPRVHAAVNKKHVTLLVASQRLRGEQQSR